MKTKELKLCEITTTVLFVGFEGEQNYRRFVIDASEVFDDMPDAVPGLAIKPPVGDVYPKAVQRDGNNVIFTISAADCAHEGNGEYQLTFSNGDTVGKVFKGQMRVYDSLVGEGEAPDPVTDWVEASNATLQSLEEITATAEGLPAGTEPTAEVTDVGGHKNIAFGIPAGDPGQPGVSPVVTVTDITGGHMVTITDASGTRTFDVMDGAPGTPGVSPIVSVVEITGGHRVTITDAAGTSTFDVLDGAKGDPGDPTELIDDSSTTATDKVWSAKKSADEVSDLLSALSKDEKALYSLKNDTTYQANASGFNEFPFRVISGQKYKFENTSQSGAFGDIYSYTGTFSESTRHLISSGRNVAPGQYVEATAEYDDENFAVYFGSSGMTIHVVATEAYLNALDQRVEKNSYDINRLSLEKADTGITTLTRTDYTITYGRINSETGAVVDGTSFKHVEIDVENFDRISFVTAPQGLSALYGCAFYDSNGTYISGVGFGTSEIDTNVFVDVPQGAKIWKYGFYNPWWNDSTYTTFIFYSTDQTIYGLQAQIDGIKGGVSAGVVSFGDSLTQGNQDGTGNTYPKYLTDLIGEAVYNAGVGGEDSLQIASRQGGIALMAEPFTIPAATTPVSVTLSCIEHSYTEPFYIISQANGGINPVEIAGVVGTLTFTGNWATQTYTYTFTRNTAGDSVTLTRPTPIITATSKMRGRVQIFWVGTNDYPHNLQTVQEKIVPRIDAMIAWTNAKNYLVIGLTAKVRFADLVDCNTYMQRHFGTRFIDISRYILQYGLQDESITPTAQDSTDIANGEIPTSLRTDSVHLNRYGYDIVAKQVYKRGQLLGYWE